MRDRLIFFLLWQIRLEGCKKYPNCYYQFIPTKNQLKLNTFLLKLVTVLGRTISSFYCNCLLFLQQLPKALFIIISSMQTLVLPLWKWWCPSKNRRISTRPPGYLNPIWKLHGMPLGANGAFPISPISQTGWWSLEDQHEQRTPLFECPSRDRSHLQSRHRATCKSEMNFMPPAKPTLSELCDAQLLRFYAVGYCILFIQNEIWDEILLSKYWLSTSRLRSLLVQKAFVQCANELALAQQDKKILKTNPTVTTLLAVVFLHLLAPYKPQSVLAACISSAVRVYATSECWQASLLGSTARLLLHLAITGRTDTTGLRRVSGTGRGAKCHLLMTLWLFSISIALQPALARKWEMGFLRSHWY